MDDDAELGIVFTLGLVLGLIAMWAIFTARGRRTAQQVFEAAEDLAEDLAGGAGDLLEQAGEVASEVRRRAR
jgi:hypothetical protein